MNHTCPRCQQHSLALVLAAIVLAPGCLKPPPKGTHDEILVATFTHVWSELQREIVAALESRSFTVRDERIFDVAHIAPQELARSRGMRQTRQILLIRSAQEPVIAAALKGRPVKGLTLPTVIQLPDVWSQNQLVTVALLPE